MRKQTKKQQAHSEKLIEGYKLLIGEETNKCVQCGRTAPINYELGLFCLTCIRLNQFKAGSRRRRNDSQRDN